MKMKILLIIKLIVFIISSTFTYITFVEEQMGLLIIFLASAVLFLTLITTDIFNQIKKARKIKEIKTLLDTDPDFLINEFLNFSKKEARNFNTYEEYIYYSNQLLKQKEIYKNENNLIYNSLGTRILHLIKRNILKFYNVPGLDEYILRNHLEDLLYGDLTKEDIIEAIKLYRQLEEYKSINDQEKIKSVKNKIHSLVA